MTAGAGRAALKRLFGRIGGFLKRVVKHKVLVATVELTAGFAVIVTVVVMWVIYLDQREDARVLQHKQMAVEMLTLSHNENIVRARFKVTHFVLEHSRQIHLAAAARSGQKSMAIPMDDAAREAFVTMTDFYDEVLKCRESGECDATMIDLWFRYDICGFTEFAQLSAFPALVDDFGTDYGERLIRYRQTACPRKPV
ncbi:hypothetical protein F1640_03295 [Novosphingobium sp. NBM11]|uniref:hypothetical protein n=1 Tax=Novosphingobium sp. NBM11 TaxID=2596914 RepID=UPI0018927BC5|nr:hypothetical protein [Novosphingobium sp. NBM11]MBF5089074.1 hypothetical protein [Novosphingobium sp. NBM11]